MILRTLGPTWYKAQIGAVGTATFNEPTPESVKYIELEIASGTAIYTDIVTTLGVLRVIDGMYLPMAVSIRADFDAESRSLGN